MLKEGRYVFTYPSLFLNLCYRTYFFSWIICRFIRSPYLCNVFFIVLDLRLTKVGVQRYSFFLLCTFLFLLQIKDKNVKKLSMFFLYRYTI